MYPIDVQPESEPADHRAGATTCATTATRWFRSTRPTGGRAPPVPPDPRELLAPTGRVFTRHSPRLPSGTRQDLRHRHQHFVKTR
jgi:hypothetical protein